RELAESIVQQGAQALDRARLYEAERAARAEAEAAQERVAFLAEASEILGSSLDYEQTLASIAGLAVRSLADWCAIDMAREGGTIERLAVIHSDPAKV